MAALTRTRYWAVVPAAGGGSRMNSLLPKQYLPLRDRSLLEWSLAPLLAADWIDGVVVALAADDTRFASLAVARHPKLLTVSGGEVRSVSVLAGLEVVAARSAAFADVRVLVHDAARPCLHNDDLLRLRDEADAKHGGILAMPVVDTLKRARQQDIAETLDRAQIWRAQTPQLFALAPLREALRKGIAARRELTDEASAMEYAGFAPRLVRGSEANIKVTYPEDLSLAAFWLAQREHSA